MYPKPGGKYDGKYRWNEKEIICFIEDYRNKLCNDNHDGLIIIHRGHGGMGTIIASDGTAVSITRLHDKVSGCWLIGCCVCLCCPWI